MVGGVWGRGEGGVRERKKKREKEKKSREFCHEKTEMSELLATSSQYFIRRVGGPGQFGC